MTSELTSPPFLEGLTSDQLEALARIATRVKFPAGTPILRQREAADRFYLIEQGQVSLDYEMPRARQVQIQTIGPGEALGWSWLAEPHQWQFSARAIDDVTARVFQVAELRALFKRDPDLAAVILERIARILMERLQATRHKLLVYVQRASGDEGTQQVS